MFSRWRKKPEESDVERLNREGDVYYQQGHNRQALACYERALFTEPNNEQALINKNKVRARLYDDSVKYVWQPLLTLFNNPPVPLPFPVDIDLLGVPAVLNAANSFKEAVDNNDILSMLNYMDEYTFEQCINTFVELGGNVWNKLIFFQAGFKAMLPSIFSILLIFSNNIQTMYSFPSTGLTYMSYIEVLINSLRPYHQWAEVPDFLKISIINFSCLIWVDSTNLRFAIPKKITEDNLVAFETVSFFNNWINACSNSWLRKNQRLDWGLVNRARFEQLKACLKDYCVIPDTMGMKVANDDLPATVYVITPSLIYQQQIAVLKQSIETFTYEEAVQACAHSCTIMASHPEWQQPPQTITHAVFKEFLAYYWTLQGKVMMHDKHMSHAITHFIYALEYEPTVELAQQLLTQAYITEGIAVYQQSGGAAALPYFERVLQLDSAHSTAVVYMSCCLSQQNKPAAEQLAILQTHVMTLSTQMVENKSEVGVLPMTINSDVVEVLQSQVLHAVETSLLERYPTLMSATDGLLADTVQEAVVMDPDAAIAETENRLLVNLLDRAQVLWDEEKRVESDRIGTLEHDTATLTNTLSTALTTLATLQQQVAAQSDQANLIQTTIQTLEYDRDILMAEAADRLKIKQREEKIEGSGYPVLWIFYQAVQRQLTAILLSYTLLDSQLVKADVSGWSEKAHSALGYIAGGLETIESLNPEPVSRCVMAAGLYGFERMTAGSRATKIARVAEQIHTVAGVDTVVAETVCLLVQRYESQLAYLTEAGARQAADYAIAWIQSVLVKIEADTLQGKTLAMMLVDSFMNCDLKRGLMGKKHKNLETINEVVNRGNPWKEANIFRKPGVRRHIMGQPTRYYSYNSGWPMHPKCDAHKYGYCLGTDELMAVLQYQQDVGQGLQPQPKKQTITTPPFIAQAVLLDLMD